MPSHLYFPINVLLVDKEERWLRKPSKSLNLPVKCHSITSQILTLKMQLQTELATSYLLNTLIVASYLKGVRGNMLHVRLQPCPIILQARAGAGRWGAEGEGEEGHEGHEG